MNGHRPERGINSHRRRATTRTRAGEPASLPRWGSTARLQFHVFLHHDCPTPVGVYHEGQEVQSLEMGLSHAGGDPPKGSCQDSKTFGLPHAGGDLPRFRLPRQHGQPIAPRRWGSAASIWSQPWSHPITPRQGDPPLRENYHSMTLSIAPRRWGSTRMKKSSK